MMEESAGNGSEAGKTVRELAIEGQKHLEATVAAAHQILASMNDELCNPSLWIPSANTDNHNSHSNSNSNSTPLSISNLDISRDQDLSASGAGGGALEEARLCYKSAVTSLRRVISSIGLSEQSKASDDDHMVVGDCIEPDEIQSLEQRVQELSEEVTKKNHFLKVLIGQLRDLISDISMWQCPAV